MADIDRIEYHRLETNDHAEKAVILIEREARQLGEEKKISGQISALRHIHATADRLAQDIIENLRRNR